MNTNELKAAMVRKSITQKALAKELGVDPSTMWQKISGHSQFTLIEIKKISICLGLTNEQRDAIFF